MLIETPVAAGELLDKMSILEIKSEKIKDAEKLKNVSVELELLKKVKAEKLAETTALSNKYKDLKKINEALWVIEDDIRECERQKQFDEKFVQLARDVYFTNDKRCEIKRDINVLVGSQLIEEKSYQPY